MGQVDTAHRMGSLTAGVLPPPGLPLPTHAVGVATWTGRGEVLRSDPELLRQLLRLGAMRRELRFGRLAAAAAQARGVDLGRFPDAPPETVRTVGVLGVVGSVLPSETRPEERLSTALEHLKALGTVPPMLLDKLLDADSKVAPEAVSRIWTTTVGAEVGQERRLVLTVRRLAEDHLAQPSATTRQRLGQSIDEALRLGVHRDLAKWCTAVRGRMDEPERLRQVVAVLEANLPLTDPLMRGLYGATRAIYAQLDRSLSRPLSRLTFSAWSTLVGATTGRNPPELIAFSAPCTSFRLVFERLLEHAILRPFLKGTPDDHDTDYVRQLRRGQTSLGLGTWKGLLFSRPSGRKKQLATQLQEWFASSPHVAPLRHDHILKNGLNELLRVQLNKLPHDEALARETWREVFATVQRVGFGVASLDSVPEKNAGLVGALVSIAARSVR